MVSNALLVVGLLASDVQWSNVVPVADECYNHTNEISDLTWCESYYLMGYLAKYRATGNVANLSQFVRHADAVLANRDNRRGFANSRPVWSSTNYSWGMPWAGVISTGMISFPLVDFAWVVSRSPAIAQMQYSAGRTYANVAGEYQQAIAQSVVEHASEWNPDYGSYRVLPATASYLWSDNGVPMEDNTLPLNYMAALGRSLLRLYQLTGSTEYLARVQGIAYALKEDLEDVSGSGTEPYAWHYWPNSIYADTLGYTWIDDCSHGGIVADFARLCAEAGVVFDQQDMQRLVRTFTDRIYASDPASGPAMHTLVDGSGGYYSDRHEAHDWIPLARYDASGLLHQQAETLFLDLDLSRPQPGTAFLGAAYLAEFGGANGYGQPCTRDSECASHQCYAGLVCGNPLGAGSSCTRDLECSSGICRNGQCRNALALPYGATCKVDRECSSEICFGGMICGNPLGAGSTCTRDHECDTANLLCVGGVCSGKGKPYGIGCNRDAECSSGICFASTVCGNPLGVTSVCTRNKECASQLCVSGICRAPGALGYGAQCMFDRQCASNICFDRTVCGNPLGAGSTCFRDKECLSFSCSGDAWNAQGSIPGVCQ